MAPVAPPAGPLNAQLWVRNLLDRKFMSNAFGLIGTGGAFTATVNPTLGDRRAFERTTSLDL